MESNLGSVIQVDRSHVAKAADKADSNADNIIDMLGYDGVLFIAALGTLTSGHVTSLKAQSDTDPAGGTMADITGAATAAMADADSNKLLVLDVYRPQKRYVRAVVCRATQNAVIDGVIAIKYRGTKVPPPAQLARISQTKFVTG